ncbi:hypothetical protein, partial [Limosilactobacillus fermentum]
KPVANPIEIPLQTSVKKFDESGRCKTSLAWSSFRLHYTLLKGRGGWWNEICMLTRQVVRVKRYQILVDKVKPPL